MLSVSCPTCGSTLGVPDEMLGQQARCGGCQEVFVIEAPAPPRRRDRADDDDDRPSRRRSRRDDDDEDDDRDRPSRRARSRYDEDDEEDDRPRKKRKKRRMKKDAPGKPGLSVAAAILFLIWGGIGAIFTLLSVVGLIDLLDRNVPASAVLSGLVSTVIGGCFAAYLIISGLKILNGEVEDIASIGVATLAVCGAVLIWGVVRVAMVVPVFAATYAVTAALMTLLFLSGIIVGGIFCIVCGAKYEKWQRS